MDEDRRPGSSPSSGSEAEVPLDVIPLHSTNLLTVLDENGVVQYESPSIKRIFGYEQDELIGEQVADYFHPDDREDVVEAFQAVVSSEEYTVEAVEYRHEQATGTYTWVESIASANPTPGGDYVVNTRDVSDRKEREKQLADTNDRLEEFVSIVGHDLRNPLNVARARLELAREECDSDHLDDVARSHERMNELIDELLSLRRRGDQDTESIDFPALTETCWGNVATGGATIRIDIDQSIRADRSRLAQLLENLMRNAVEHGGEEIHVEVGSTEEGFYVEDDGPGIPPDERDAVFDAGYSTSEDGTGFGLAIVEQVADDHGWDVRVTDGENGGTRFEVTGVEFT